MGGWQARLAVEVPGGVSVVDEASGRQTDGRTEANQASMTEANDWTLVFYSLVVVLLLARLSIPAIQVQASQLVELYLFQLLIT